MKTLNKLKNQFQCDICGYDDEYRGIGGWSVTGELWNEFGNGKGMMCMDCFEKRIGRKLTSKDFTATSDNHSHKKVQQIFENEGFSKKAGWRTEIIFNTIWQD